MVFRIQSPGSLCGDPATHVCNVSISHSETLQTCSYQLLGFSFLMFVKASTSSTSLVGQLGELFWESSWNLAGVCFFGFFMILESAKFHNRILFCQNKYMGLIITKNISISDNCSCRFDDTADQFQFEQTK